ncbi:MAG: hypothetical protein Q4A58_02485 [Fusobacterium sp.]|uniref:hypothetical protein n=1 Tax=Fusobacterium sp. TaxID=68766 RepID=UPI0026DAC247|nr:hypothetical protein [Fusobacterium sp.]MDO4690145.1 hypothetical protein [Fusobacterium sp.]
MTPGNKKLPNLGIISRILKKKTWEEILIKIDRIEIQKTFIKEKMKKEYIEISEKLNKQYGASIPDIKRYSKYSVTSFYFVFRGMEGLRKECNFENPYLKSKLNYNEIKKTAIELFKQYGELSKTDLTKLLKEKEISIESIFKAFKVMNMRNLYKKLKEEG